MNKHPRKITLALIATLIVIVLLTLFEQPSYADPGPDDPPYIDTLPHSDVSDNTPENNSF